MGAAMARSLLAAGHGLVVHNRTRAKAEELAEHGANVADSPREVAEACSVVVTMLPGSRALYAADGLVDPLFTRRRPPVLFDTPLG